MLPTFVVFFREILEVSIILSIIAAATRGVEGRTKWILIGLFAGLLGAGAVAFFADKIAEAMHGMGQEMFNATVLSAAAFMIAWTVVWMKKHAREMVARVKNVGAKVQQGDLPLLALSGVVAVCLWREGSEIVLFMYGILTASNEPILAVISGGVAGTLVSAAVGFGMYKGIVKIPTKYFFRVTEWMLIFLSAGLAMQAAGYMIAADFIPALSPALWDSSHIISEASLPGQILHAMVGYTSSPNLMHIVVYVSTIVIIIGLLKLQNAQSRLLKPALVGTFVAFIAFMGLAIRTAEAAGNF